MRGLGSEGVRGRGSEGQWSDGVRGRGSDGPIGDMHALSRVSLMASRRLSATPICIHSHVFAPQLVNYPDTPLNRTRYPMQSGGYGIPKYTWELIDMSQPAI